mgnify:CR=1 FL=1
MGMPVVEADLLVENCLLVPMDGRGPISGACLAVKDGRIIYADRPRGVVFRAEERLDATGMAALPGFVNAHTHAPMTLLRGLAEDVPLDVWLKEHIWPVEAKLRPEHVYWGALLACLEMALTGTTCFCDMYFHEAQVAEAALRAGLRAVLAPGIFDVAGPEQGEAMLKDALRVVERYQGAGNGRLKIVLGPHAPHTCSPELLERIADEAERLRTGIHIHLAETEGEVRAIRERYGKTPVEFLDELGLLGPGTSAAHCVYLTERDMAILAQRGVGVVHCPVANAKLGVDVAPVPELLASGVAVALGTDGPASNNALDMLETVKFACLLHKAHRRDPTVLPARRALEMATLGGARALGLDGLVGSLTPGKRADFILLDLRRPSTTPVHDVYAALVYSARSGAVEYVFVDGEPVVAEGRSARLDADEVLERARELASELVS